MVIRTLTLSSILVAVGLCTLGTVAPSRAIAADASADQAVKLQEVVVTAQKREEKLQDVPAAVTALTGATLEAMGAESFVDYARSIPGLTFQDSGAGRETPTIRGVNPSAGAAAVGYYIGEAPIPTAGQGSTANPQLIDIDRIEVLRGPQGTLYGSSSIGGTIKLVPRAPNLAQFEGSVKAEGLVTQGGDGASPGGQAELVLNVPIVDDKVAVRGAFWYRDAGGFINRTYTNAGASGIATGPIVGTAGNVGDERTWGFRTTGLWQPTDQFSLSTMAYVQHQHFDGFTDITGGAGNPNDRLVQNFISNVSEPQDNRFELYNLTAKFNFNRFSLLSSTSYSRQTTVLAEETTSLLQLNPTLVGKPSTDAVFPGATGPSEYFNNFTEEARLASTERIAGFDAVVGVFYSKDHDWLTWYQPAPQNYNSVVAGNDPTNLLYVPNNNFYTASGPGTHQEQTAEFGELTYHFTDSLSLTGGLRHYNVSNDSESLSTGWYIGLNDPSVTQSSATSSRTAGYVYKGNLSYKITPDHLLYLQYAEGFRPGFGTTPLPPADNCGPGGAATQVQPDSIKSYEFGAKTAWLEQRLTANAAVYRINWTDIQQGRNLPCGFSVAANFGGAVIKGAELEFSALLTQQMSAGLSATYMHTELQQDVIVNGVPPAFAGDPIQAVPNWQYSVYVETKFTVLQASDTFARMDYQYTGSSPFDYVRLCNGAPCDTSTAAGLEEARTIGVFDPAHEVQVVRLLNLRTGLRRNAWEFALSATNALNSTARQSFDPNAAVTLPIPGRPRYVITRPRTFSLSALYQF